MTAPRKKKQSARATPAEVERLAAPPLSAEEASNAYEGVANAEWILERVEQRSRMLEAFVKAQHLHPTIKEWLCTAVGDITVDIGAAREHVITAERVLDKVVL